MKIKDIYNFLDSIAPFDSAEEWDNVGLLVGQGDTEVKCAVVALDCTPDAIRTAKELSAQLIITHHPVIFDPLTAVTADTLPWLLAKDNISVISAHTNLDKAESGVNAELAKSLELNAKPSATEPSLLVAGLSKPELFEDFVDFVKDRLNIKCARTYKASETVSKIALCCGSGGDLLQAAVEDGCDTLITGDIKHNVFIEAAHKGINLIDAGHYATEDIIIEPLALLLQNKFPQVEFVTVHSDPFRFI